MNGPNIEEVAKAAGVHKSTVSRAFSRPEVVREETREHIIRVAESLGYTISPLAQALRRKTSNLVPLIVPDITNPFFGELARTMTAAAEAHGYQLVLCVTDGDDERTEHYLASMQSLYAPFAIVAPSTRIDPGKLEESAFGHRVVVIDRFDEDSAVPTVTVDSTRGIELAFDHLTSLGHRSIGYVSGIVGTHTAGDRRAAFDRFSAERGTGARLLGQGQGPGASARAAAEYVASVNRPTAIIAANDVVAFALVGELARRGVRVPDDVSVIGFDGLDLGARSNPRLTTIRQPIDAMGEIALQLASRLITGDPAEHIVLEPSLLVRDSTKAVGT